MSPHANSFKTLLVVSACALATVVAVDFGVRRVAPLKPTVIDVEDGVIDVERGDPDVVVLGSSHTRSFRALAELLPDQQFALVAVEEGTFRNFNWVLNHRLRRLIDERDASGQLKRKRLSRLLLITTYWDMCSPRFTGEIGSLPARAWTFRHFADDFIENGLTDYNRNYLNSKWKKAFPLVMTRSRGEELIPAQMRLALSTPEVRAQFHKELIDRSIEAAHSDLERGRSECDDARQKRALDEILDFFNARDVEVTVVLFPLVKEAVSDVARQTTLRHYASYIAELNTRKKFKTDDLTLKHELETADFMDDMDHVSAAGNRKLQSWALERDFAYLKTLPQPRAASRQ